MTKSRFSAVVLTNARCRISSEKRTHRMWRHPHRLFLLRRDCEGKARDAAPSRQPVIEEKLRET